jgi:hypothetical protein
MGPVGETTSDDLAFLRRLVEGDYGAAWRSFGKAYFICGLMFGAPAMLEWARLAGLAPISRSVYLPAALVATLMIFVVGWWAGRGVGAVRGSSRSLTAVFAGIGWANVAVLAALVAVSNTLQDGRVMMVHAVVVFAFQGAAWYVVWILRRRLWMAGVALGWYAIAVVLGFNIANPADFLLICGLGLLAFMSAPGWALMHGSRQDG